MMLVEFHANRFHATMVGTQMIHIRFSRPVLGIEPEDTLNFDQLRATIAITDVQYIVTIEATVIWGTSDQSILFPFFPHQRAAKQWVLLGILGG